jgi:hypothetical protein
VAYSCRCRRIGIVLNAYSQLAIRPVPIDTRGQRLPFIAVFMTNPDFAIVLTYVSFPVFVFD